VTEKECRGKSLYPREMMYRKLIKLRLYQNYEVIKSNSRRLCSANLKGIDFPADLGTDGKTII
jgi:hypothetical protein